MKSWRSFLLPLVLGLSLLGVYLRTLAPGLTWVHYGADGGDLITAAATGGVPHPTGYPLYMLLAGLFQFLPAGSLAYRTNLMSAVFSALAGVLIYQIVVRHLAAERVGAASLAGLSAGYAFGLAPLVWSQAVITEVYTLQAFLVACIFYLYSGPVPDSKPKRTVLDRWRGAALGLAMANHLTSLLLVPAALLLGSVDRDREAGSPHRRSKGFRFDRQALGRQLLWMAAGLSLYLILPLSAYAAPPVNWGNATSLPRLAWLVSGEMYRDTVVHSGALHLWQQVQGWIEFTLIQFGVFTLLGLLGLLLWMEGSRLMILTVWTAVTSLAFVSFYRPADAQVYLLPLVLSFSIWLGIGAGRLAGKLGQRSYALGWGVGLLILGMILVRPLSYARQVDASRDRAAESFGREVLSSAPQNALLFTQGDRAVFALWYFHYALHQRPDLVVVAQELLSYEWYQETLRATYPSLQIIGQMVYPETITRANSSRPVCTVRYSDRTEMSCTPGATEH